VEGPLVAGPGIEEDGDHKKVDSSADFFFDIRGVRASMKLGDQW